MSGSDIEFVDSDFTVTQIDHVRGSWVRLYFKFFLEVGLQI